ncbi:homoserine dehydrogenase [Picrophilus oshimae]|uniref:Homoserine dehydrogenase n=1 Tax=Picrophilus torridus (strain ATCC 700027 / DSM 9790 / JCM 10055 / NBRC 100828 / KAW 2/3) TaxID=1122961 RepID=Q6KZ50_PICTO|nr:homoserine dehydrogenase [Picrophilus oshimae]AAT44002.1 homoserine dehydrogenase [Picrophilus oshimae DSM 9789]SMD30927.1 homoserine dehydrogenase [Picrophilus oshimae DSM 9789]
MRISIIGLGHIGLSVLDIIKSRNDDYRKNNNGISIVSASDSKLTLYNENGLDPGKIINYKKSKRLEEIDYEKIKFDEIFEIKPDVIVDVSPATKDGIRGKNLYINAFEHGIDIVTANKAPLALHWHDIMDSASKNRRIIRYEASVGGGVPLFNLRQFCTMSSRIINFTGLVSSTINYVLNQELSGVGFLDAVKIAQNMGIAETDYSDDTMGLDSARKTVILANSLFNKDITLRDVTYDGIENIDISSMDNEKVYRVVAMIENNGGFHAESKIRAFSRNDFLGMISPLSMAYSMETDINDNINIFENHDGPLQTAAQVVNDVMLLKYKI